MGSPHRPRPCDTDDSGFPADPRLHHELMLGGQVFHDLAIPALEPLRADTRRLLQERVDESRPEREQPELGGKFLLAKPVGQLLRGSASLLHGHPRRHRSICRHVRLSSQRGRGLKQPRLSLRSQCDLTRCDSSSALDSRGRASIKLFRRCGDAWWRTDGFHGQACLRRRLDCFREDSGLRKVAKAGPEEVREGTIPHSDPGQSPDGEFAFC